MELQKLYVSLVMEMKEYAAGLDDAADRARSFGDRLKGALGGAATAVTAGLAVAGTAVVGLASSSVGVARDFQSSMAVMSTAVDPVSVGATNTADAMAILSKASLAVGSDTALVGVSASSSAEAITGLYKAGLSTGEIFGDLQGYLAGTSELGGALRASIDLAAASELDMNQASGLAAVTLATFGGELTTTEERAAFVESAMNNFVQTADGSVASVADLQAAFVNVGPTASAMGMGVEDVNTALGILSTRGITGSEAGTALKSMLVNMQRTTPDVTDTLDALGVSLYDAQGVMYSLPEIIGQLQGAMAGMTDEQRQQTVTTLAGSYGMNAMNTLLGEGTEGWAAMEASIAGAATMQETAAARTNTLAGAQEALGGVWESFQIQVGTALIPVLTMLADVGASLIEKYGPTLTAIFGTIGAVLGGFFANLQEGMAPLDAFIEAIWDIAPQPVLDALVNFRDNILPGLTEAFHTIVDPIVSAVTNFVSFQDVLIALGALILATVIPAVVSLVLSLAPILLAVAGVIAVVALLRNAWEGNWGGIRDKTEAVVNFIRPLIEGFLSAIRGFWDAHGAGILAAARAAWEGIKAGIETVVNVIRTVVTNFLAAVKGFWEAHGQAIKKAAEDAWNLIQGVIEGVVETIKDIVDAFKLAFEGDWEAFGGKLFEIWEDSWTTLIDFLQGLWDMVLPWLTGLWESVKTWFTETDWAALGLDIINGIVNGLVSAGQAIVDTIAGFAQAAWDKVKAFFGISSPSTLMYWAGRMIGQGFIDGIRAMAAPLAEVMDALFKKMGDIANLGGGFANLFKDKTIDPMLARLDELRGGIDVRNKSIEDTVKRLGLDMAEPGWELMLQRFATSAYSSFEQRALAQNALAQLGERRDMTLEQVALQKELAAQQERIAAIEERRAQIGFLQQQLDLLKMIKDNNLDASILDGIKLGLDADVGGLMDAMAEAMRMMIKAAEDELGVHSPSRWARGLMQNVMGTLAATADRERAGLRNSLSRTFAVGLEPALAGVGAGVGAQTTDNSRRTVVNGGVHNYYGSGRGSALDEMEVLMR